jgi:hypothetical protein
VCLTADVSDVAVAFSRGVLVGMPYVGLSNRIHGRAGRRVPDHDVRPEWPLPEHAAVRRSPPHARLKVCPFNCNRHVGIDNRGSPRHRPGGWTT